MTVRSFLVLCAVTLVVIIAAGLAVIRDHRPDTAFGAAEKVFPQLLERTEALAVITLRDAETTLTIQKDDDGWTLREFGGYPVRADAVRALVLKLAGLEKVEAKTDRADLYPRLGVEDVATTGARSKEVELLDDEGTVVVRVLVGKSAFDVGEKAGLYVRIPDDRRSWLVRGRLAPGLEVSDWVHRRITDIPGADVQSVRIVHPDEEIVEVARPEIDDRNFALEGLGGEPSPQTAEELGALAQVLDGLDLEDLRQAEDIPFADDVTLGVTVSTFDGLAVTVDLTEHDGRYWIRLAAQAAPNAEADAKAASRELGDRTSGWAYQVSAVAVAPWKKRKADWLEPADGSGL